MSVVLSQTGNDVMGTFNGEIAEGISAPIAMTGSFDASRTLRIQGSQPFVWWPRLCRLPNWHRLHQLGDRLGRGKYVNDWNLSSDLVFRTTDAYPNNWEVQCEILSLRRS
jgi:hypothetical protein